MHVLLKVQYSCGGVIVFCLQREIVFGVLPVVSVFLLWRESFITTGKKVLVVCLVGCAVVSVFGSGDYDWKKKSYSRLSGGLC